MTSRDQASPGFFRRLGQILSTARVFTANALFVVIVVLLVFLFLGAADDGITVPDSAALVLTLDAPVVEEAPRPELLDLLMSGRNATRPIQLRDLARVLEAAAEDDRIGAVVLDLDEFPGAAPATLRSIGQVITDFRSSGKPVVVVADALSQSQYFLATFADQLYLNPMGQVLLSGLAVQPLFFGSALDRLRVNMNVFRVGDYKAAIEPFTRDDMSAESRENAQRLVDELWAGIRDQLARNRGIDGERLDSLIDGQPERLRRTNGDLARLALETGLVDELLTRDAGRDRLVNLVGRDDNGAGYSRIGHRDYLRHLQFTDRPRRGDTPVVGVIVAEGTILGGEQAPGTAVGEQTVRLIREAREEDNIRAIVLRVNSPGGSAFASESIRRELELAQVSGKPVVVSMGGLAASGGYWISATADRILAEPDTITGSIGVYMLLPTFEDSGAAIGVHSDGVGTHALSGAGNPLMPLNPVLRDILEQRVVETNRRFVELVARGRNLAAAAVDDIAGGRVWSGQAASELGLVDELGGLDAAVAAAAELAGIDRFETRYLEDVRTTRQLILERMLTSTPIQVLTGSVRGTGWQRFDRLVRFADEQLALFEMLIEQDRIQALCMGCAVSTH